MTDPRNVVNLFDLDLGEILGQGGFGRVQRIRVFNALDNLAFKKFLAAPSLAQVSALDDMIEFRRSLSPADATRLDAVCSWPKALVEDSGSVIGYLMPLASPEF